MKRLSSFLIVLVSTIIFQQFVFAEDAQQQAISVEQPNRVKIALDELEKQAKLHSAAIKKLDKELAGRLENIQQAETYFQKLSDELRTSAEEASPNSQFVKLMEDFRSAAISDAEDAAADGSSKEERFRKQAETFERIKVSALKEYDNMSMHLRELNKNKKEVIRAIKLNQYEEATQISQSAINAMKQYNDSLDIGRDALNKLEENAKTK